MALEPGTKLGHYEVLSSLGAGIAAMDFTEAKMRSDGWTPPPDESPPPPLTLVDDD